MLPVVLQHPAQLSRADCCFNLLGTRRLNVTSSANRHCLSTRTAFFNFSRVSLEGVIFEMAFFTELDPLDFCVPSAGAPLSAAAAALLPKPMAHHCRMGQEGCYC